VQRIGGMLGVRGGCCGGVGGLEMLGRVVALWAQGGVRRGEAELKGRGEGKSLLVHTRLPISTRIEESQYRKPYPQLYSLKPAWQAGEGVAGEKEAGWQQGCRSYIKPAWLLRIFTLDFYCTSPPSAESKRSEMVRVVWCGAC